MQLRLSSGRVRFAFVESQKAALQDTLLNAGDNATEQAPGRVLSPREQTWY